MEQRRRSFGKSRSTVSLTISGLVGVIATVAVGLFPIIPSLATAFRVCLSVACPINELILSASQGS
eukprot:COSAG05_NODE_2014_length_3697_cov_2.478043_2_plen_66_part_00